MNQRMMYYVFSLTLLLFLYAVSKQWTSETSNGVQPKISASPSFEEVALKYGTDKVTTHKYQFMYDKYLREFQGKSIKLLEIGLGCNMDYGPGASYYTWLEYLPGVELYFIEYDSQCADKYKNNTTNAHVFTGDQSDINFLKQFGFETTREGRFDVIIDDGGHTMNQQIISLENLWDIVKPGGLYVIEDLQTSFWDAYGGDPSANSVEKLTTMKYLYRLLNALMAGWDTSPIVNLQYVDCMAEICALRKESSI